MSEMKWRAMRTAPKDGTLILLAKVNDPDWGMRCRRWVMEPYPHWRGQDADEATHWMLLPEPPKLNSKQGKSNGLQK